MIAVAFVYYVPWSLVALSTSQEQSWDKRLMSRTYTSSSDASRTCTMDKMRPFLLTLGRMWKNCCTVGSRLLIPRRGILDSWYQKRENACPKCYFQIKKHICMKEHSKFLEHTCTMLRKLSFFLLTVNKQP